LQAPAVLERSRSGNGGHVWLFFEQPVPAALARKLASCILTETMAKRPDIGFDSYDRFIPNQDTLPQGGLGNLIALPLQKESRTRGNSLFLDDSFVPYQDHLHTQGFVCAGQLRSGRTWQDIFHMSAPGDDLIQSKFHLISDFFALNRRLTQAWTVFAHDVDHPGSGQKPGADKT